MAKRLLLYHFADAGKMLFYCPLYYLDTLPTFDKIKLKKLSDFFKNFKKSVDILL